MSQTKQFWHEKTSMTSSKEEWADWFFFLLHFETSAIKPIICTPVASLWEKATLWFSYDVQLLMLCVHYTDWTLWFVMWLGGKVVPLETLAGKAWWIGWLIRPRGRNKSQGCLLCIPAEQVSIFITWILIRSINLHYTYSPAPTGQRLKSCRIVCFTFSGELMDLNIMAELRLWASFCTWFFFFLTYYWSLVINYALSHLCRVENVQNF